MKYCSGWLFGKRVGAAIIAGARNRATRQKANADSILGYQTEHDYYLLAQSGEDPGSMDETAKSVNHERKTLEAIKSQERATLRASCREGSSIPSSHRSRFFLGHRWHRQPQSDEDASISHVLDIPISALSAGKGL
jgi:hypothetical protein